MSRTNDPKAVFNRYAEDRRHTPIDSFRCEVLPHLTRYTPLMEGMEGLVMFARLPDGKAQDLIRSEIQHFSALVRSFEWKVYEFDQPSDLQALLEAEGFIAGDSETFMVYPSGRARGEFKARSATDIRRVRSVQGLEDIVSVQQRVWNQDFSWLVEQLSEVLTQRPTELSLYCAYIDGQPVGCGWTSFPSGSVFAELHGGSVLESHRGRGIYGDLYRTRCAEIAERGYAWTAVDTTDMSRPILEKLGFERVCLTYPMRFKTPIS